MYITVLCGDFVELIVIIHDHSLNILFGFYQFLDYSDDENEEAVIKKEGRKQR